MVGPSTHKKAYPPGQLEKPGRAVADGEAQALRVVVLQQPQRLDSDLRRGRVAHRVPCIAAQVHESAFA